MIFQTRRGGRAGSRKGKGTGGEGIEHTKNYICVYSTAMFFKQTHRVRAFAVCSSRANCSSKCRSAKSVERAPGSQQEPTFDGFDSSEQLNLVCSVSNGFIKDAVASRGS